MAAQMATKSRIHDDYTVGCVCALPIEQTAVTAMLDQRHADLPKPPNDSNTYTLGSVGNFERTRALDNPSTSLLTEQTKGGLLESRHWIIDIADFQQWRNDNQSLTWIKGYPGTGKSTLPRHVNDGLKVSREADLSNHLRTKASLTKSPVLTSILPSLYLSGSICRRMV
jgi:hypothetical protein